MNEVLTEAAPDLYRLLEWMTRSAKMKSPLETWVYFISAEIMDEARALVEYLKAQGVKP